MLVGMELTGVWVSDEPLTEQEGASGPDLIEITLPDDVDVDFDYFEVVEEGKLYREWCLPAAVLNRGALRLVPGG